MKIVLISAILASFAAVLEARTISGDSILLFYVYSFLLKKVVNLVGYVHTHTANSGNPLSNSNKHIC